jgi:hypothetical protein
MVARRASASLRYDMSDYNRIICMGFWTAFLQLQVGFIIPSFDEHNIQGFLFQDLFLLGQFPYLFL